MPHGLSQLTNKCWGGSEAVGTMGVGRVTWCNNLFRVPVQNVLDHGKFRLSHHRR